ncbi:DUF1493 family protein [Parapedobacter sp. GCM10030251]|uniref:DUF1493 family protein n=1 Tax=Parapedobacter sp. GCM10030251 TaxID=3273419 RepID=UPI003621A767
MEKELRGLIESYNPLKGAISNRTRLYHDLNIYGDDADELLSRFSELYGVDLSKFRFNDYFPNEGDWILPSILRLITLKPSKTYKELTVENLEKAIEAGYLE